MSQFGFFVYSPAPADPESLTPQHIEALERYPAQVEELGGQAVSGYAFQSSTTAKSIRGDTVTDGPFEAKTKVLAGYYVLETPSLDVAVEIAKLNPAIRDGGVEVRPLFIPPSE